MLQKTFVTRWKKATSSFSVMGEFLLAQEIEHCSPDVRQECRNAVLNSRMTPKQKLDAMAWIRKESLGK